MICPDPTCTVDPRLDNGFSIRGKAGGPFSVVVNGTDIAMSVRRALVYLDGADRRPAVTLTLVPGSIDLALPDAVITAETADEHTLRGSGRLRLRSPRTTTPSRQRARLRRTGSKEWL